MDDKLEAITAWCNRIRALGMTVTMAPALGWLENCVSEITRLRAEVERLTRQVRIAGEEMGKLCLNLERLKELEDTASSCLVEANTIENQLRAEVADLKRQIELLTDYDTATLVFMKDSEIADLKYQLAEIERKELHESLEGTRCANCHNPAHEITIMRLESDLTAWTETAARHCRNESFYRDLLDQVAAHLGAEIFVADDGSIMDSPLRLKIPELVADLKRRLAQAKADSLRAVCAGSPPISGLPCICGGTGRACDEAPHARERVFDLERQLAEANHWLLSRETELKSAQDTLTKAYEHLSLAREENLSLRQREARA